MKFLSSIFSFDTLRGVKAAWPKGAIVAVAIVAVAEAALHVAAPYLPEPVIWGKGEAAAKIAQASALGERTGGRLDVLILGPSHASVGISPRDMQVPGSPAVIYNGAINGRDYPVLAFVLKHVYLRKLSPKTLVISASPICFNDHCRLLEHNTKEFFEAGMAAAMTADGLSGAWQRFLINHVYLYRYRYRERGLSEGRIGGKRLLDDFGHHAVHGTFDAKARAALMNLHHGYQGLWRDYSFGGPAEEAFVEILELAKARGIRVAVVNFPFRPALFDLPGDGPAGYRKYLAGMKKLEDRYGFRWLDYQAELDLTDADFRDVDHLNAEGAAKLSRRLARDLALE